jgi:hypothetical protein
VAVVEQVLQHVQRIIEMEVQVLDRRQIIQLEQETLLQ